MSLKFVESAAFEKLLKCPVCDIRYNSSSLPRVLPCGKSMCSSCLQIELGGSCKFKCRVCDKTHEGSLDRDFPTSVDLVELLNIEPKTVYQGDEVKSLLKNLDLLSYGRSCLSRIIENPHECITDSCEPLKNRFDIEIESLIQELETIRIEFFQQVDCFEQECKTNLDINLDKRHLQELVSQIDLLSKKCEDFLQQNMSDMNKSEIQELDQAVRARTTSSFVERQKAVEKILCSKSIKITLPLNKPDLREVCSRLSIQTVASQLPKIQPVEPIRPTVSPPVERRFGFGQTFDNEFTLEKANAGHSYSNSGFGAHRTYARPFGASATRETRRPFEIDSRKYTKINQASGFSSNHFSFDKN